MSRDELQLREFFDHRNDAPADFLGQHDHRDVLVIFETVTDDRRIVSGNGKYGEQFRFRTGFQAEIIGSTEVEDFFDDLALLIHLYWVNADVTSLVSVLAHGRFERLIHFA